MPIYDVVMHLEKNPKPLDPEIKALMDRINVNDGVDLMTLIISREDDISNPEIASDLRREITILIPDISDRLLEKFVNHLIDQVASSGNGPAPKNIH